MHSPHSAIRYNQRVANVFLDRGYATLATVKGRIRVNFCISAYFRKYDGWVTRSSHLVYDRGSKRFYLCVSIETNEIPDLTTGPILGIDRGINNIAVTSANQFFNSKAVNNVRGKYAYLRKQLQSKGTHSAKRKLQRMSGKEKRFKADVNHCIAKELVNSPFGVFVLEDLKWIREKTKRKKGANTHNRYNTKLGSWSFLQLERFIEYKAEGEGKTLLFINPAYTSISCSRCGYRAKGNRQGAKFLCQACGHELHADLNASRNIAQLGKPELSRLTINQPNVAFHDLKVDCLVREQLQATHTVVR